MTARKLVTLTTAFAALATAGLAAPAPSHASLLGNLVGIVDNTTEPVVGTVDQTAGTNLGSTTGTLVDTTGQLVGTVDSTTGTLVDSSGQVIGTVDSTTGLILDSAGNVVGVIAPSGGSGSTGTLPGGVVVLPPQASDALALALALSARRVQNISQVARRGIAVATRCTAGCGVLSAVTIDGATARKLGLGSQPVVIGRAIATTSGGMRIRLTSRARRALTAALPSRRQRAKIIRAAREAQRAYRGADTSRERRVARSRYLRYRRVQRRWARGWVRASVVALGVDGAGRLSPVRSRVLSIKG